MEELEIRTEDKRLATALKKPEVFLNAYSLERKLRLSTQEQLRKVEKEIRELRGEVDTSTEISREDLRIVLNKSSRWYERTMGNILRASDKERVWRKLYQKELEDKKRELELLKLENEKMERSKPLAPHIYEVLKAEKPDVGSLKDEPSLVKRAEILRHSSNSAVEIRGLHQEIAKLKSALAHFQDKIVIDKASFEAAGLDHDSLTGRVESLQAELAAKEAELYELNSAYEKLFSDFSKTQGHEVDLKVVITQLDSENTSLKEKVASLQEDNVKLKADLLNEQEKSFRLKTETNSKKESPEGVSYEDTIILPKVYDVAPPEVEPLDLDLSDGPKDKTQKPSVDSFFGFF